MVISTGVIYSKNIAHGIAPTSDFLESLLKKVLLATRSSNIQQIFSLPELKKDVALLNSEQLLTLLQSIAHEKDGKEILERLADILSPEQIEKALQKEDGIEDLKKEASRYLKQAKSFSPSLSTRLLNCIDSTLLILESFLNSFGIAEFFKPLESKSDAKVRAQTIMMLLQFSVLLATIVLPIFGPQTGFIIAGIMFSIWTLSLVYPHIRKMPSVIVCSENWSRQYRTGKLSVGGERKYILDEIARALQNEKSMKMHALLLGKSGIGKTEAVKSLVAAIEKGEYPHLKGKEVFYINTADLINRDEGTKILARINEMLGRHRKNIILVLDEIHIACQKRESFVLADQLKTLLDEGEDNFQNVIGITTEDEFYRDIFSNNPAFARRFQKIMVQDTSLAETVHILQNTFIKQAPEILLEPGIFETIVHKSKELAKMSGVSLAQPAASLKLLYLCIKKTAETQKSLVETQIEAIQSEIMTLSLHRKEKRAEIQKLEKQLMILEGQRNKEQIAVGRFYQKRARVKIVKEEMYKAALSDGNRKAVLWNALLIPQMENEIRIEAEKLGVKTMIDEALVTEVLAEEKKNIERSNKAKQTMPPAEEIAKKKKKTNK